MKQNETVHPIYKRLRCVGAVMLSELINAHRPQ